MHYNSRVALVVFCYFDWSMDDRHNNTLCYIIVISSVYAEIWANTTITVNHNNIITCGILLDVYKLYILFLIHYTIKWIINITSYGVCIRMNLIYIYYNMMNATIYNNKNNSQWLKVAHHL